MGYIKTPYGFIYDAPQILFERCDGRRFFSDTGSAGTVTTQNNSNAVYGGWNKTPLGYVDGNANTDISFTDVKFRMDMVELSTNGTMVSPQIGKETVMLTISGPDIRGNMFTSLNAVTLGVYHRDPNYVGVEGMTRVSEKYTSITQIGTAVIGVSKIGATVTALESGEYSVYK